MANTFLEAEWRKLVMANYIVDQKFPLPYLPHKTEIDTWKDSVYISLVGFMFLNTKVKGIKIPFHVNFEEINLRFYVRYKDQDQWRRGVVFIKEIVPGAALSLVANTLYGENYETMPMDHAWATLGQDLMVEYRWKKKIWNRISVTANAAPQALLPGSEEEFITEHFWGYTRYNESKTSEYGVEHPRWEVYPVKNYAVDVDFADIYGANFGFLKTEKPQSVFLAEGSEIKVKGGRVI